MHSFLRSRATQPSLVSKSAGKWGAGEDSLGRRSRLSGPRKRASPSPPLSKRAPSRHALTTTSSQLVRQLAAFHPTSGGGVPSRPSRYAQQAEAALPPSPSERL